MAKKKVPVVEGDKITVRPPKLPDSIVPPKVPEIEILKSIHQIDEKNTQQQHRQYLVNVGLMITSILFAAYSTYLTYKSKSSANEVKALTANLSETEVQVSALKAKMSEYQAKIDSLTANGNRLKKLLEKHGISE